MIKNYVGKAESYVGIDKNLVGKVKCHVGTVKSHFILKIDGIGFVLSWKK